MARSIKQEKGSIEALKKRVKLLSRELEIEAALEKVRSRAMSMRSSDMLAETSAVMFKQIQALGIDATRCGVGIFDDAHDAMEVWLTTVSAGEKVMRVLDYVNLHIHPVYENILAARKRKKPYAITVLKGEEVTHYYNTMSAYMAGSGRKVVNKEEAYQSFFFDQGTINITTAKPLSEEERTIMVRFAKVFGLIYLRFVDLQRAEAQASEARIEASLERVRGRSLAMRKSNELSEVAFMLYKELRSLGVSNFFNCGFVEVDTAEGIQHGHMTRPGGKRIEGFKLPLTGDPILQERFEAWQRQDPVYYQSVGGDELKKHLDFVGLPDHSKEAGKTTPQLPDPTVFYAFNFRHGYLHILSDSLLNADEELLAARFARVFEIAYRRFLDLKIAEAQAREAQIEAALERIRSRSMAMQRSEEMREVIGVVMNQFHQLGFLVDLANFNFPSRSRDWTMWLARPGYAYPDLIRLPYLDHVLFNNPREAVKKGADFLSDVLSRKEGLQAMRHFLATSIVGNDPPKVITRIKRAKGLARSMVFGKHIALTISNYEGIPYTEEQNAILRRFHGVFEQSYTRFLDLQKAETQTREAQIELALERVRARTMAMHQSAELVETSAVLFHELKSLGVAAIRTGVAVFDKNKKTMELWSSQLIEQKQNPILGIVPVGLHPFFSKLFQAWLRGDSEFIYTLSGEEVKEYYQVTASMLSYPRQSKFNPREVFNPFFFPEGSLTVVAHEPLNPEERNIMRRFANVFGLLYRRFLDLQKAEAQAREAQVEAALERVRSRSMAMHKSDELHEVIKVVSQQLKQLKIKVDHAGFVVDYTPRGAWHFWIADEQDIPSKITHPYFDSVWAHQFEEAKAVGKDLFVTRLDFEEKNKFYRKLLSHVPGLPQTSRDFYLNCPGLAITTVLFKDIALYIENFEGTPYTEEENNILYRFGKVFQQTYTRFLDLQKAEAQAREAQIEAALERVRAQTMAMHNSADVGKSVVKMFSELTALGVHEGTRFGIGILNHDNENNQLWTARKDGEEVKLHIGNLDMTLHPLLKSARKAWIEQIPIHRYVLEGNDLPNYYQMLSRVPDYSIPINIDNLPEKEFHYGFNFNQGFFYAFSPREFQPDLLHITQRFAKVFEQTYTRFLDLKRAEAQAREAQIEAALERVRSRSMAMHKSEELSDCAELLFSELSKLGGSLWSSGFAILSEDEQADGEYRTTDQFGTREDVTYIPNQWDPTMKHLYEGWKLGKSYIRHDLGGDAIKQHYARMLALPKSAHVFQAVLDAGSKFPDWQQMHAAYFKQGYLLVISLDNYTDSDLLVRFARVFEQTYTRFLDLKKVEAQAREAHLEASLERVRGKAMGMHNSGDLVSTIKVFYQELELLNLKPRRCGVGLLNRNNRQVELSTISEGTDGTIVESAVRMTMEGHPVLEQVYENYLNQQEYHPVLRGNEIKKYNQAIRPQADFPDFPEDAVTYGYFFYVEDHGVYAWTDKELSEDELKIYRRFTSVLTLTYKRYRELKEAEERARIAVRDASLDRVRAEIASMRTADDLQRITPLIWRELRTLGVPFFRCGVLIVNEKNQKADYYLSTPEGHPLAALHLDFNTDILVVQNALEHWRQQKVYKDHWNKEQFVAFARSMMEIGQIQTMKSYQGGDQPPEAITLQFTPFAQGMLYVGSAEDLTADQINLVQALADAFSTAYARYEDFTRLEAAKATVERALSELRTTQNQLVQSEKMASLGELTAGIAHEIQNPLNFVNNFSEVSKELLDEMKAELASGNWQPAAELAENVIQNLEKINFHGKRADGIVKSMLQHSRKSTGQKELTDINALCDEYLRLAYHGLRAKDKSFSAKFETDFDPSVGQISVLPQEIGRVVLNLINNAFYAVSEKLKAMGQKPGSNFEPTVIVSTQNLGNKIEISVRDNGNGIPASIKDKIFQPFFTTKPTGQGTGLGLSLSYDIITKGHGGEIKVESWDGEGSQFIIQLPA